MINSNFIKLTCLYNVLEQYGQLIANSVAKCSYSACRILNCPSEKTEKTVRPENRNCPMGLRIFRVLIHHSPKRSTWTMVSTLTGPKGDRDEALLPLLTKSPMAEWL